MVVYTFIPSTQEAVAGRSMWVCEFEDSLAFRVSSQN